MKMKTFYANTMAEAMDQIKTEFGSEALLLSSRRTPGRSSAGTPGSGYEVLAALDDGAASANDNFRLQGAAVRSANGEGAVEDVCDIRPGACAQAAPPQPAKRPRNRKSAKQGAAGNPESPAPPFDDSASQKLYQELLAGGVYEWLARKLVTGARESIPPKQRCTRNTLMRSMSRYTQELIPESSAACGIPAKRVVVFIGPTGVGKTTSIAKLAARLVLEHRKKVVLMTLDGCRIGAIEQLRAYAGLMGIPFRSVSRFEHLPRAIQEHAQRDFILIDTAGKGPRDLDGMRDFAEFIRTAEDTERHLVVSATTKPADLCEIVDRFEICGPDHLLFTKLDETTTLGPILNELVRTRKPLSYYTDGQRVPDDLHPVRRDRVIDMVLHRS